MTQKTIAKMTGYKATDKDMRCRGHQFELGKWYEVDGELSLCHHGFHFCDHPSGPWTYHNAEGTRVFTCEAEDVLDLPVEPGADHKQVARRIRLVAEIIPDGNGNTGDGNTGYRNTGDWNTGCGNTGDGNTGNWNTGNRNTGDGNTGDRNTSDRNTGDRNTGSGNTGDRNTGNGNTGDGNTGDGNTGDGNTGYGCAGHHRSDIFGLGEDPVQCFGKGTGLTYNEFFERFPIAYQLGELLAGDDPIPFEPYKDLPGITKAKLKALHDAHIKGRKA